MRERGEIDWFWFDGLVPPVTDLPGTCAPASEGVSVCVEQSAHTPKREAMPRRPVRSIGANRFDPRTFQPHWEWPR